MELTDPLVSILKTARVDTEYQSRINSLDFHRSADLLVTAADDDSIKLYGLETGTPHKTLHSKKYGISHVNFTHHPSAIVFASNKGTDHALRYLSVHDNKFIRYLRGHMGQVTSLGVCPKSDLIMSTAQDRTMRLWDLRAQHCQGLLEVPSGIPIAAFDLQGLIFCVGLDSGIIKLYDVRSFDKGPFSTFVVADEANSPASFGGLKFSPDGKILAAVVGHKVYQLDAYNGGLQHQHSSGIPEGATPLEVCFSPDNKYLLSVRASQTSVCSKDGYQQYLFPPVIPNTADTSQLIAAQRSLTSLQAASENKAVQVMRTGASECGLRKTDEISLTGETGIQRRLSA